MSNSLSSRRLQTDPSLAQAYLDHERGRLQANAEEAAFEAERQDTLRLCEQIINQSFPEAPETRERFLSMLRLRFVDGATLTQLASALHLSFNEARALEQQVLVFLRREMTP